MNRCERCQRVTRPGRTLCRDCSGKHPRQVRALSDGRWLEWTDMSRRGEGRFLFLDLIDRSRPERRDRVLLHFVWDMWWPKGLEPEGQYTVWFGGMINNVFSSEKEALAFASQERDVISVDITLGIYQEWVDVCYVCDVPVTVHTLDEKFFEGFKWAECPSCHRRWERWTNEDESTG